MAVAPAGGFVHAASIKSNNIAAFAIDSSSGALTAIAGSPFSAREPTSLTIDPAGRFLYATNLGANTVSIFSIDPSTGALTSVGQASTDALLNGVALSPSGQVAYAANVGSNSVQAYSVNSTTGMLTPVGSAVATGVSPEVVQVDPSGKFLYVAVLGSSGVAGAVYGFNISASSGALTSMAGSGSARSIRFSRQRPFAADEFE